MALGAVAEETDLDPLAVASGVFQGVFDGQGGELLDGLVDVAAERGHADADDVYVFHPYLEILLCRALLKLARSWLLVGGVGINNP
ncbi:hypothetical protein D3C78_1866600 [compost metagenome]